MLDVIVIGARCAGAPAAMQFARAGLRVLLVDRTRFPADKLSTLYIQQPGVVLLRRWGLLDKVVASGCPPLDHVVYELGDVRVEGCADPVDGVTAAYAPRRHDLDRILADAAVEAGAEFRDGCSLAGVVEQDGRVTGVRLTGPDGREYEERARLVVGADGMRSTLARLVSAPKVLSHPRLTCAYYTFWRGPRTHFELYEGPTGWVSAVPTTGAVLISAYYPQRRFAEVKHRAREAYLENVRDNAPGLYAKLAGAEQVERLHGTGDQQNFFRQGWGPGWVLIGDAAHHKDSLTARGIGDAFLQAQLLADRAVDAVGDPARLDEALKTYVDERDQLLMESYRATLLVAQAEARDKRRTLLRAVATSPEHTRRYFNTVAGLCPVSELYTPDLLALLSAG